MCCYLNYGSVYGPLAGGVLLTSCDGVLLTDARRFRTIDVRWGAVYGAMRPCGIWGDRGQFYPHCCHRLGETVSTPSPNRRWECALITYAVTLQSRLSHS